MPKRDPELEKELLDWIEATFTYAGCPESKPPNESFEAYLKDGTVLCRFINILKPGSVKKIVKKGSGNFQLMGNVENFQKAIKAYGIDDREVFQTCDLFEQRNIVQVALCLWALARQVHKYPDYQGPKIAYENVEENKREFTQEQLDAGKHSVNAIQMGYAGGANQSGTNIGNTRHM